MYKRSDFIKLDGMIIYSRVNSDITELCYGLFCKTSDVGECGNDFCQQDLIAECGFTNNIIEGFDALLYQIDLRDNFKTFRTDLYCNGRDGMFDEEDLFVVWDNDDIKKLINYLTGCIKKENNDGD